MGAEEDIAEALRPTARAAGLEIWDVERSGASVRVMVDGDGGVDLDAIAKLSSAVSAVLDERDDLVPAGRYILEVSSPGLERRLRHPVHFARCIGEEVVVKTSEPVNGSRRTRGTLVGATDQVITVRALISKTESQEVRLALSSIERANTVFSWGSASPQPDVAPAGASRAKVASRATPASSAVRGHHPAEASEEAR